MTDLATLLEVGGPVAALGGGAAYTRARHPGVYWSAVGLPLSTVRLLSSYSAVMEACGLTVAPSRLRVLALKATTRREIRAVPPRRGIIRPTTTGLRLRLRLAPGQEPADVAASAERLRHAWGVHAVYVTTVRPGVVELRLVGYDVLRRVRMPRKADHEFLKVPVALREDATPFVRDYRTVPHGLVLGATLSGKSMYLRHLISGLAPQPVALVGIDCKRGVELAPFAARLSALATDPDEAAELLPVLVGEMEDRYDLIRARQGIAPGTPDEEITSDIWGLPEDERPVPIVLFVDEVAELFLTATKKDEERRDEMVTQLIRLAQLGRAAGIYLEVCGQRFGAELGKGATMLRAQLTGRVCHRVNDEASAKMALGDIAPEAVAAACAIAPECPGLAVAGDTSGGWSRIRTPYLSLGAAADVCRKSADLVPDIPALKSFRPNIPVQTAKTPGRAVQPDPVTS
ncbi:MULTISPECIES: FtsK/SpoIIIE domain-containing protein [unclassified Streptomyces]|uniref:FtsK/SpoIIIE domain-containing protein n=1 Tax=unclassified Streptomyces TaxID=2593676 RepID=UPI001F03DE83|nr:MULTISPECIES: FtsK/SpoIIIE domain-containing protein [unclassified Streptomyces]MCH0566059.1 conjugal transfer protein TraS [Streptomyces sp. MUM 2J]MCH0567947.1 conjugal transfer protein TraS [Streptomyces sp. MUM 136J]